jgi:hypothetical protein
MVVINYQNTNKGLDASGMMWVKNDVGTRGSNAL